MPTIVLPARSSAFSRHRAPRFEGATLGAAWPRCLPRARRCAAMCSTIRARCAGTSRSTSTAAGQGRARLGDPSARTTRFTCFRASGARRRACQTGYMSVPQGPVQSGARRPVGKSSMRGSSATRSRGAGGCRRSGLCSTRPRPFRGQAVAAVTSTCRNTGWHTSSLSRQLSSICSRSVHNERHNSVILYGVSLITLPP